MNTQQSPFLLTRLSYQLCAALCLSFAGINQIYAETAVGKATLVIGTAYIENNGERQRLESGDAIFDEHEIITTGNGYVHIRFDDQGLVSVRNNSRLLIEKYDYNSLNPSQSTVKFSLEKGSARSVSGKAAQSAKQRFRMNTPIAAIGVRGTDFVIRADQKNIQAIVNEGAIVVAPFSSECSVEALGPCVQNAVTLRGESKKLLQYNSLLNEPQLIPASDELLNNQLKDPQGNDINTNIPDRKESYAVYTESQVSQSLSDAVKKPVAPSDFTPPEAIAAPELTNNQLVWGHWGNVNPTDKIALASAEASEKRKITIANSRYGLFREGESELINTGLGIISFNLNSAQAEFISNGQRSAMVVSGGYLDIDFNSRNFNTGLSLRHDTTGNVSFSAAGQVNSYTGFFSSKTPSQRLGGAVSLDGQEAGYYFRKDISNGSVEGLTLWGAK